MVELQESSGREYGTNRELALLLDVSLAGNSARACHLVDEFVLRLEEYPPGVLVDINAGDLLLTRGVLTKIKQQIVRAKATLGTVYSTVPQTQQAALDEGLFVKGRLLSEWTPIRQPLPAAAKPQAQPGVSPEVKMPGKSGPVTRPAPPVLNADKSKQLAYKKDVDLPDFRAPRPPQKADFQPVAPQLLEIPELAAPEVVAQLETEETTLVQEVFVSEETVPSEAGGLEAVIGETAEGVLDAVEMVYPETAFETLYVRQNLRSGQTVRFNGNVVIVGDVHAGSEVTAGGDILIWGELRGIAHAGAQGNYKSEIRAMKIEALQLRIADYIARRPDRIYYHKDQAEAANSPEVAKVADGEIKIFKTALPRH